MTAILMIAALGAICVMMSTKEDRRHASARLARYNPLFAGFIIVVLGCWMFWPAS